MTRMVNMDVPAVAHSSTKLVRHPDGERCLIYPVNARVASGVGLVMMSSLILVISLTLSLDAQVTGDLAKGPTSALAFDIASVKQNTSDGPVATTFPLDAGDAYSPDSGLLIAKNFSLITYIEFAYKLQLTPRQEEKVVRQLPKWARTERFDIQARSDISPTKDQMRMMMQSLLATRFQLRIHFETKNEPVYALVVRKSGSLGPKLKLHSDGPSCQAPAAQLPAQSPGSRKRNSDIFPPVCDAYMRQQFISGMIRIGARNTSLALLAKNLPALANLDRPVIDRTELTGMFDFSLEWSEQFGQSSLILNTNGPVQATSTGPSFPVALSEQLGLQLQSQNGPVNLLMIDHVSRPSED